MVSLKKHYKKLFLKIKSAVWIILLGIISIALYSLVTHFLPNFSPSNGATQPTVNGSITKFGIPNNQAPLFTALPSAMVGSDPFNITQASLENGNAYDGSAVLNLSIFSPNTIRRVNGSYEINFGLGLYGIIPFTVSSKTNLTLNFMQLNKKFWLKEVRIGEYNSNYMLVNKSYYSILEEVNNINISLPEQGTYAIQFELFPDGNVNVSTTNETTLFELNGNLKDSNSMYYIKNFTIGVN